MNFASLGLSRMSLRADDTITHLNELIEGNGIVPVCVGFLYGSVGDAAQLLVRDVHAHHHPQDLWDQVVNQWKNPAW